MRCYHVSSAGVACTAPAVWHGRFDRCGRHVLHLAAELDTIGVRVAGGYTGALVRRWTSAPLATCGHVHGRRNYGVGCGQGAVECAEGMIRMVQDPRGDELDSVPAEFAARVRELLKINPLAAAAA